MAEGGGKTGDQPPTGESDKQDELPDFTGKIQPTSQAGVMEPHEKDRTGIGIVYSSRASWWW